MYRRFIKRILDCFFALMLFPFWLVVLVVLAPLIHLEDGGPVFYNAPRLGKNGNVFTMYKFRSMKTDAPDIRNADGSTFTSDDDPRLTRVGRWIRKTSLDETPQLLNVIKGDMSFVGPRPDKGNEVRKLEVRPGITGYNQAYYRNAIEWKERIRNDVYYVDHMSFWFDTKILMRTVLSVLRQDNIYPNQVSESNESLD